LLASAVIPVCCVAILVSIPLGCATEANNTRRYERAMESLESERKGDYCSASFFWAPIHGNDAAISDQDAIAVAKRKCVATLSNQPGRPGRNLARERVLDCMLESGWKREPGGAPGPDGQRLLTICLSGNP